MADDERTARLLEQRADGWAAPPRSMDPPPAPAERAWQQDMIRDAYEDAARLTGRPLRPFCRPHSRGGPPPERRGPGGQTPGPPRAVPSERNNP
ncbi:hypothetical protein OG711_25295 [Streptomyces uncialis]|uniref:hypothetical protein n=1 Tax=Streptomyces uncialis TaxID=1048205 RepID=UPI002E34220A|nr:hypothetical protein [Streptomyces uncialis]